jgi:hypothetical protein
MTSAHASVKRFKIRTVLKAIETDPKPKDKTFFQNRKYQQYTEGMTTRGYEVVSSCAIGGAADVLNLMDDGHALANALQEIPVPREPNESNLVSKNYRDAAWGEYHKPTLRKRLEYLSDSTDLSKKEIAQHIRDKYPNLLDKYVSVKRFPSG